MTGVRITSLSEDQLPQHDPVTRAELAAGASPNRPGGSPQLPSPHLLEADQPLITRGGWMWIGILSLLFVLVHGTYLQRLFLIVTNVTKTRGDNFLDVLLSAATTNWNPDWSHALVMPLISLYFLHQNRARLAAAQPRISWWGLPILILGLLGHAFWIYPGQNDMFQGYCMILGLFGLVLLVLGPSMMKVLWFPILYLVFAVKISDKLWEIIATNLQYIAAACATVALKFCTVFINNFDVENRRATIDLTFMRDGAWVTEPLNVAEACSGLRMLMAFVALGVALAFLWERVWWQRLAMIVMAVPIAVFVNIGRVTAIGLLYLVNKELASGDFHTFIGMLMLIPAALLFMMLGWALDRIIVRDYDEADDVRGSEATDGPHFDLETLGPVDVRRQASFAPRPVACGLATGVGLVVLVGLTYTLLLASLRPDLLLKGVDYTVIVGLLSIAALFLVTSFFVVPRLLSKAGGGGGPTRQRTVALSLVAGALLTTLVGQSWAIDRTEMVLIKSEVDLRHPLLLLPTKAGTWAVLRDDPPLAEDMVKELGTHVYLSRWYKDTAWARGAPGRIVRLHVAYYTGTPDTVPHVPEVCFFAGGATDLGRGYVTLMLSGEGYRPDPEHGGLLYQTQLKDKIDPGKPTRVPDRHIKARIFTFGNQRKPNARENVLYFFAANGKFLPSPEHVRLHGFDPRDKYSYHCKIEVQLPGVADKQLAIERTSAFLSDLLPEIMACLPDWVDVTEGRWPADRTQDRPDDGAAR